MASWLGKLLGRSGEDRTGAARELAQLLEFAKPELPAAVERLLSTPRATLEQYGVGVPEADLGKAALMLALGETAASIDWRSAPDEVLAQLEVCASQLGIAPLWTDEEEDAWDNAEQLFTWQLVEELVGRFEAAGFRALDGASNADGFELSFVKAEDERRAAALLDELDSAGDLRLFRQRKHG